jgi:Domain of unknown function (DUF4382)/Carboxypeptidase regulatory-like domain
MMKKINYLIVAVVLILSFSCSTTDTNTNLGGITIKLTDAPMPYDQFMEASITIDKVEIGLASDPSSFIVIMNETKTFNMINMINGITEVLAAANIPEGKYDTLRLYISSAKMQMNSGDTFTYDMSENTMSGGMMGNGMSFNDSTGSIDMPLDHFIDVQMGSQDDFLMDIDIDHSFVLEGVNFSGTGSGMMMSMTGFTFNPTMRFVNLKDTGSISGFVHMNTTGLENVTISLMQNGTVYTSTHTDTEGHYKMIGIPVGNYTIMAEADGFIVNSTGNDNGVRSIEMMKQSTMTVDFDMVPAN